MFQRTAGAARQLTRPVGPGFHLSLQLGSLNMVLQTKCVRMLHLQTSRACHYSPHDELQLSK